MTNDKKSLSAISAYLRILREKILRALLGEIKVFVCGSATFAIPFLKPVRRFPASPYFFNQGCNGFRFKGLARPNFKRFRSLIHKHGRPVHRTQPQ